MFDRVVQNILPNRFLGGLCVFRWGGGASNFCGIFLCYRARTGPGNPGKSLNLKNKNPGLESPGIINNEKRDCKNSIC